VDPVQHFFIVIGVIGAVGFAVIFAWMLFSAR
jgi:hypothetical protein